MKLLILIILITITLARKGSNFPNPVAVAPWDKIDLEEITNYYLMMIETLPDYKNNGLTTEAFLIFANKDTMWKGLDCTQIQNPSLEVCRNVNPGYCCHVKSTATASEVVNKCLPFTESMKEKIVGVKAYTVDCSIEGSFLNGVPSLYPRAAMLILIILITFSL